MIFAVNAIKDPDLLNTAVPVFLSGKKIRLSAGITLSWKGTP